MAAGRRRNNCGRARSDSLRSFYDGSTGMLDVPIGLFFFILAASATMAYVSDWPGWRLHFILCAAFFVGLKPSFIVFLPGLVGLGIFSLLAGSVRAVSL